jgi:hypothetical protein
MRALVIVLGGLLVFGPAATGGEDPPRLAGAGELEPFPIVQKIEIESGFSTSFAISPDGQLLAVADGVDVRFWNPRTGKQVGVPWKFESDPRITGLAIFLAFVDNKTIALSRNRKDISLREYPTGRELQSINLAQYVRSDGWIVAPGLLACAGTHDNRYVVRLFKGPKWEESWRAEVNESSLGLAFSPDRSELAVGEMKGGSVRVYSVKDGKLLRSSQDRFHFRSSQLTYSPDGRAIAVLGSAERPRAGRRPAPPVSRTDNWPGVTLLDANLADHRTLPWGGPGDRPHDPIGCAFSADGKTLIVPCSSNSVRLYEVQTGKLRHVGAAPTQRHHRFAVSPDGKLLVLSGAREVVIMDWRAAKPDGSPARDPATLWDDLASPDSEKGYRAVMALGARPADAAKLIGDSLKPAAIPNAAVVKALVADLDADDFATREAAQKELAKLGEMVEPQLRDAAKSASPERRRRADELLIALSRRDNPGRLRALRAVEVLEHIDTPAGRDVLKSLAGGVPSARLTRDAKAALARLQAFDPKP